MTVASEAPPHAPPVDRITREEYARLPEGPPYYELIDGELIEMSPRPLRSHYLLAELLSEWLGPHVRRLRGELAPEPNLFLPGTEDVYHPDLAYVARSRRRAICREEGIYGASDLVCEFLSPTTAYRDQGVKLEAFRRAGVRYVWLIHPQTLLVEEFVLEEDGRYRIQAVATPPTVWSPLAFPGWSLDLGAALIEVTDPPAEDDEAPEGEQP
jgi:Uma2 family endonuclease